MLLVPPRHGKSELASRRFPALYLGHYPDRQFISVSATADFAADFGRDVRNIITSQEYVSLFPEMTLSEDSAAKNKWHTSAGGVYVAAGIGSQIMGRGAHVALIDDPFPTMEAAQSELQRKNVRDYYTGTLYNRLMPNGAIVIINHRMHEDDLVGFLLEQEKHGGDRWLVVKLPAINDSGDALWPEFYPLPALERIKLNTTPFAWSALYQQNPIPDEGNFFKREWLKTYDTMPNDVRFYGASDYAVTADGGDYTVHIIAAMDKKGDIYVCDLWRGQETADRWIDEMLNLVRLYNPLMWAEEQGQIIKSVGPFLLRRMDETKTYVAREQFTSANDKPTRARSIQARMATGKVKFKAGAPWLADLIAEILTFPVGKFDDQVDSLSLLGRMLAEMIGKTVEPPKPKLDRYDRAFDRAEHEGSGNWKTA